MSIKYGRLTPVEQIATERINRKKREPYKVVKWRCVCDCGGEAIVFLSNLKRGHTQSCGCLQKERAIAAATTHGKRNSKEYDIWNAMKSRCKNPKATSYKLYGGRGISYAARWEKFENFIADMGPRPEGAQIDRIDNNKDYGPDNCRWATVSEQTRNRRSTILVTLDGKTACVLDHATERGLNPKAVYARLKAGWPVEDALARRS